jgi:hypothetical protein
MKTKNTGSSEALKQILKIVEQKLKSKTAKASVSDYIRLLELQRDAEKKEQITEVVVRWIDPEDTESLSGT